MCTLVETLKINCISYRTCFCLLLYFKTLGSDREGYSRDKYYKIPLVQVDAAILKVKNLGGIKLKTAYNKM